MGSGTEVVNANISKIMRVLEKIYTAQIGYQIWKWFSELVLTFFRALSLHQLRHSPVNFQFNRENESQFRSHIGISNWKEEDPISSKYIKRSKQTPHVQTGLDSP